jgi:pyruvyl transferase EpsO
MTDPASLNKNALIIARLQEQLISVLRNVCPQVGSYSILDFPDYANVGDSAIYLGQLVLLKEHHGRDPSFVSKMDMSDLSDLAKQQPEGPIFLTGGGNFGDLWPQHQRFREAVLERFPHRQIVQLPQSIHYDDPAALHASAQRINAHKNFTLLVRDHKSLDLATRHFSCHVRLCPDAAFMIGPLAPPVAPSVDIFCLLRTDKEAAGLGAPPSAGGCTMAVGDWLEEPRVESPTQYVAGKVVEKLPFLRPLLPQLKARHYQAWAEARVQRGIRQLSSGRVVVTDRLHAHILSILLGKQHVALDNSYGKISSFVTSWTEGGDFLMGSNLTEAVELAKQQLDEPHEAAPEPAS